MGGCMSYRLKLVHECDELVDVPHVGNLFKELTPFSFKYMKRATNNFNPKGIIRYSVSSRSYKGILCDGSDVIVMVYSDINDIEFDSMIRTMSGVKHKNVVELIGYCIEGDHRILVHEFVGMNTLDQLIFCNSVVLDWPKRVSVCQEIARGLDYLHRGINPCVVHCDVKPSNILMDCGFHPKIKDFELSCLLREGELHHSGPVAGTLGYIAPELYRTGRFSEKTDVYAFGITVLEIVSGKRNSLFLRDHEEDSLMHWAWKLRLRLRISEIVDKKLSEFSEEQVNRLVNTALSCVQLRSDCRPSMSEVRLMLSDGFNYTKIVLPLDEYIPRISRWE